MVRDDSRLTRDSSVRLILDILRQGLDPAAASDYELDPIIPLALGGHPRKLDHLQLQPWEEVKRKDRLEVKLQCLVCSG